jgi:hypothetical protein
MFEKYFLHSRKRNNSVNNQVSLSATFFSNLYDISYYDINIVGYARAHQNWRKKAMNKE